MKTNKLIILGIIYILIISNIEAQTFCNTPSVGSTSSNYINSAMSSSAFKNAMSSTNNATYYLKIYIHVIRRSNGTGGQTVSNVNEGFTILNQDFNPHNIYFVWDNQIDYINNDSYYSLPTSAIFNINNHQDGIDIYLYDENNGQNNGSANGVGKSSEFYVSGSYFKTPYANFTTSHVISHEMGHIINLYHTHNGTSLDPRQQGGPNPCKELVNSSNSATCGDYITDTPADIGISFNVTHPTCVWNGSGRDANGDSYNPDETLIMAYMHLDCMSRFTPKQGERMRNAIDNLRHLQNALILPKLTGSSTIYNTSTATYTLKDAPPTATVTWSVSYNLKIISSTNTNVRIRHKSGTNTGNASVSATINNGKKVTVKNDDFT